MRLIGWGKLWGVGVLASVSLAAGDGGTLAPVLRLSATASAEVAALEGYRVADLTRLYFGAGDVSVRPTDKIALDELAKRLLSEPNWIVELRGYAEGGISADQNLELSQERAYAVAQSLILRGVEPRHIVVLGLGEVDSSAPLRAEHQRVDARIFAPEH